MKLKVCIVEDEPVAARNLARLLAQYDAQIEVLAKLSSVGQATEWLKNNHQEVDLLFLDIRLTDGLSFQVFDKLPLQIPAIFTTAYDEYAIRAFQLNSVDYLLKPISLVQLSRALQKFEQLQQPRQATIDYRALARQLRLQEPNYKSRFLVKRGNHLEPVPVESTAYFTADGNLVVLKTTDGRSFPIDYTLIQLEQLLDPALFFRISRNLLVHVQAVIKVAPYFKGRLLVELQPSFPKKTVVSNQRAGEFKEWLDG